MVYVPRIISRWENQGTSQDGDLGGVEYGLCSQDHNKMGGQRGGVQFMFPIHTKNTLIASFKKFLVFFENE